MTAPSPITASEWNSLTRQGVAPRRDHLYPSDGCNGPAPAGTATGPRAVGRGSCGRLSANRTAQVRRDCRHRCRCTVGDRSLRDQYARRTSRILDRHRVRCRERSLDDRASDPPLHDPGLAPARSCAQSETRHDAVPQHSVVTIRRGKRARPCIGDNRSLGHRSIPSLLLSVLDLRDLDAPVRVTPRTRWLTESRIEVRNGSKVTADASQLLKAALTLGWGLTASPTCHSPRQRRSRFSFHTPRIRRFRSLPKPPHARA